MSERLVVRECELGASVGGENQPIGFAGTRCRTIPLVHVIFGRGEVGDPGRWNQNFSSTRTPPGAQVLISEKLVTNFQEIWENEQHYLVVNLVDRNLQVILSQVELAEQTVHRLWTAAHRLWTAAHRLWTAAQDRSPKRVVFHAAAILACFDVGVEQGSRKNERYMRAGVDARAVYRHFTKNR